MKMRMRMKMKMKMRRKGDIRAANTTPTVIFSKDVQRIIARCLVFYFYIVFSNICTLFVMFFVIIFDCNASKHETHADVLFLFVQRMKHAIFFDN